MTDCFIMIHVIIFFVGVTETLSGSPCTLGGGGTGAAGAGVQRVLSVPRGNLCSVGVCGVGCVH